LSGRKIAVDDGDSLTIGRTQRADVVLERDAQMSGAHFRLEARDDACRLWDLDSLNGTLLNGTMVTQATLANQDRIMAGESEFQVTLIETVPALPEPTALVTVDRRSQPRGVLVASDAETKDGSSIDTDAGVDREHVAVDPNEAASDTLKKAATPTLVPNRRMPTQWFVLDVFEEHEVVMTVELSIRQWTLVGRDEDAHVFIVDDTEMSKRQLCIEVDGDDCWVLDLASSNGTQINGDWITATRVHHGDVIVAGRTRFQVRVTELPEELRQQPGTAAEDGAAAGHTGNTTLMLYANAVDFRFRVYRCHSGLNLYRGVDFTFDILQLVTRLSHLAAAYLIVSHTSRDELAALAEVAEVDLQPLLIHEANARRPSDIGPWILGPIAAGDEVPKITAGWADGVLCLFSDHGVNDIRQHCSRVYRHFQNKNPCWSELWSDPVLMADYLANRDGGEVEFVFDPFVGLLLEVNQGDRWALFSCVLDQNLLRMISLVPADDWS
jgi:pSer/pThr/pTyr-binding forkhead associated (FHA) protein